MGIGINLTKDSFPKGLDLVATSVETATGRNHEFEVLLGALIAALGTYYEMLRQPAGSETIMREWCARSSYGEGKLVRVVESNETLVGTTRGLERDGALRLETYAGEIRVVHAGEVTSVRPG